MAAGPDDEDYSALLSGIAKELEGMAAALRNGTLNRQDLSRTAADLERMATLVRSRPESDGDFADRLEALAKSIREKASRRNGHD